MSTPDPVPAEPQLLSPDGEYDDDWYDTPIAPRARTPWLTRLLAAAVIAALAFAGGAYAQKEWGKSSGSSASSAGGTAARTGTGTGTRRFGGSGGFFGGSSASGQGGSATSGQVSFVKGSTLYVAELTGSTVKVSMTGARVTKTSTVTPAAIKPGDTVVILGTRRPNGTVAARSITVGGSVASLFGAQSSGGG